MNVLKIKRKEIIRSKIFDLAWFGIIVYFTMFYLRYDFNNLIYNSILLYIFAHFVSLFFTISSLSLFANIDDENYKFNKKEALEHEEELRFRYPKLFIYNRIVFGVFMMLKFVAWFMLVYGIGLYFLK